ncbi:hypothetical protein JWJ90_01365 [Desulfobulbus rhabdoformis]|uniref:hypothetical protein n=1 Tax=Desulfobulbus rhabdoformis TaxID=34032 RepID=UPI0019655713|nr:hypothetical protein [Desulfobulbus rhabdoformis]MBM9612929.1 hypothetical protein [Desulfobulbus rhabdoformis]
MDSYYSVVFTGKLRNEYSISEVRENLSSMLKFSPEKIDKILSRNTSIVFKKNLNYEVAQEYEKVLADAGLEIILKKDNNENSNPVSGENKSSELKRVESINNNIQVKKEISSETDIIYFKSWIINFFLAIVVAFVASFVVGFVLGIVLALFGVDRGNSQMVMKIIGGAIGVYSSFYFYKWSIKKYILPQTLTM